MSKELEALERIKNIPLYHVEQDIDETYDGETEYSYHEEYDGNIKDIYPGEINIIEVALKDYESMKQTKIIVADKKISDDDLEKLKNQRMFVGSLGQCEIKFLPNEETQKKLKALEIIMNKNVNLQKLRKCFWEPHYYTFAPLDFYNAGMMRPEYLLTKEEYKLLREVLL